MHHLLINNGASTCALDDHVRPRISKIADQAMQEMNYKNYPKKIQDIILSIKKIKKELKEIIVWGVGEYANLLLDSSFSFKDSSVKLFVDSNPHKQGTKFRNMIVGNPNQIKNYNQPILIASSFWYHEIVEQLKDLGVNKSRIYSSSLI